MLTPTIFLTALSDVASLAKGFDAGADDYIKKPFDFDELLIRIHAILKKTIQLL
ncbi:MAG: response regulator [Campylobacterota bacterium]|nr:response regulator [Campylobacterota bacterium]